MTEPTKTYTEIVAACRARQLKLERKAESQEGMRTDRDRERMKSTPRRRGKSVD